MLRQYQVLELMAHERRYQDKTWPRDARRQVMYGFLAPHLVLLRVYLKKAEAAWTSSSGNLTGLQQVGKIAAIALRALEETEGSEKLLEEGRR